MSRSIHVGDMMSVFDEVDYFIICVGSKLTAADQKLVMNDGMAYRLAEKYPNMPAKLGALVKETYGDCGVFYFHCKSKLGLMQKHIVARHGADLNLLSHGGHMLAAMANSMPDKKFALEYPGAREPDFLLRGMINLLPDNVQVWKEG